MQTGIDGINLIKEFESLQLKAYKCPAGVNTIGFGTTLINNKPVPENLVITVEQADTYLRADLGHFEREISKSLKVLLNQYQFDALVCLCYNIGLGNLRTSTLLKLINKNPNDETIKAEWLKWSFANKKLLPGLQRRRKAEYELFSRK